MNGFSASSQTALKQFPAAACLQVSASTSMHADGANMGSFEASGRYNTGEYNGDGSCLWSYGSAVMQPEAGMWGGAGGNGSGLMGGNLQLTQQAGRWETGLIGDSGGQFRNGGDSSTAEILIPAAPNLPALLNNTNGDGNAKLLNILNSRPSTPVGGPFPGRFTPQQQQYSYTGVPYMPAAMTSEQAILERHLAELGLREGMAAQQAANAHERKRRQQLTYLSLLQQQQSNIRRQQQQLSQQQQAIASAAASLQYDYGQQMQQGGGMRLEIKSPYQRAQVSPNLSLTQS